MRGRGRGGGGGRGGAGGGGSSGPSGGGGYLRWGATPIAAKPASYVDAVYPRRVAFDAEGLPEPEPKRAYVLLEQHRKAAGAKVTSSSSSARSHQQQDGFESSTASMSRHMQRFLGQQRFRSTVTVANGRFAVPTSIPQWGIGASSASVSGGHAAGGVIGLADPAVLTTIAPTPPADNPHHTASSLQWLPWMPAELRHPGPIRSRKRPRMDAALPGARRVAALVALRQTSAGSLRTRLIPENLDGDLVGAAAGGQKGDGATGGGAARDDGGDGDEAEAAASDDSMSSVEDGSDGGESGGGSDGDFTL